MRGPFLAAGGRAIMRVLLPIFLPGLFLGPGCQRGVNDPRAWCDEAGALAASVPDPAERCQHHLAIQLLRDLAGDRGGAARSLQQARAAAETVEHVEERLDALLGVVDAADGQGGWGYGSLLQGLDTQLSRDPRLAETLLLRCEALLPQAAPDVRDKHAGRICRLWTSLGRFERAEALAAGMAGPEARAGACRDLAHDAAAEGLHDLAERAFDQAMAACDELDKLAAALPPKEPADTGGLFDDETSRYSTYRYTGGWDDGSLRADLYRDVACWRFSRGRRQEALAASASMTTNDRAKFLTILAAGWALDEDPPGRTYLWWKRNLPKPPQRPADAGREVLTAAWAALGRADANWPGRSEALVDLVRCELALGGRTALLERLRPAWTGDSYASYALRRIAWDMGSELQEADRAQAAGPIRELLNLSAEFGRTIADPSLRDAELGETIALQVRGRLFDDALETARTVGDPSLRLAHLHRIAHRRKELGDRQGTAATLALAAQTAATLPQPDAALAHVADAELPADAAAAATTARQIPDEDLRFHTLLKLYARAMDTAQPDQAGQVLQAAKAAVDDLPPQKRLFRQEEIVHAQLAHGDTTRLAEVLKPIHEAAKTMPPSGNKLTSFELLSVGYSVLGQANAADECLAVVQTLARQVEHQPFQRAKRLRDLARDLARQGRTAAADRFFALARQAAQTDTDEGMRDHMLNSIAMCQIERRDLDAAAATLADVGDQRTRAEGLDIIRRLRQPPATAPADEEPPPADEEDPKAVLLEKVAKGDWAGMRLILNKQSPLALDAAEALADRGEYDQAWRVVTEFEPQSRDWNRGRLLDTIEDRLEYAVAAGDLAEAAAASRVLRTEVPRRDFDKKPWSPRHAALGLTRDGYAANAWQWAQTLSDRRERLEALIAGAKGLLYARLDRAEEPRRPSYAGSGLFDEGPVSFFDEFDYGRLGEAFGEEESTSLP